MRQKEAFDDMKELSVSDTLDNLSGSAEGLTSEEAEERLEKYGLVYATTMKTYFGKTAKLVEVAKTESHFQNAVIKIGDYLIGTLQFALVLIKRLGVPLRYS